MNEKFFNIVLTKTNKAMRLDDKSESPSSYNNITVARQLDTALMTVGFKLSTELFDYITNSISVEQSLSYSRLILESIKNRVDADKKHNVYFKDFPNNVPSTADFWVSCILTYFFTGNSTYGQYQHTYDDMVSRHEEFIPIFERKSTVIHLGNDYKLSISCMLRDLMGSNIPLSDSDKLLCKDLINEVSRWSKLVLPLEFKIPIRENKVFFNTFLMQRGLPIIVDNTTDILRIACELSGGDSSLETNTKFKVSTRYRKPLIDALENLLASNPAKVADICGYINVWKRLGHNIHVGTFCKGSKRPNVSKFFHIARNNDKKPKTMMGMFNENMKKGHVISAIDCIKHAPGHLVRCADQILSYPNNVLTLSGECHRSHFANVLRGCVDKVSGRVLLSLWEHLSNRLVCKNDNRIFINKKKKSFVTKDKRKSIHSVDLHIITNIIKNSLRKRINNYDRIILDRDMLNVAVPLTEKYMTDGVGIVPRGSDQCINENSDTVRIFCHWVQEDIRTDYDLSVQMLDSAFKSTGYVSWTNTKEKAITHSGDITDAPAPNGAFEAIDINLSLLEDNVKYIIPQVHKFSGEGFKNIPVSVMGFCEQHNLEKGKPFEPQAVKTKMDMRGDGGYAVPFVLYKNEYGVWKVRWVHLFFNGKANFNMVEKCRLTNALMLSTIMKRNYITIGEYVSMLADGEDKVFFDKTDIKPEDSVLYIGLQKPEWLNENENTKIITVNNLRDIIPS